MKFLVMAKGSHNSKRSPNVMTDVLKYIKFILKDCPKKKNTDLVLDLAERSNFAHDLDEDQYRINTITIDFK